MFGKSILKLVGLVFAGAIALAGGAELLSSVVGVVLAFRTGNPFPLIIAGAITVVLLRLMKKQKEDTPVKMVLNVVSYAASGYMIVVGFVIALPFGLVVSIVTAVATSILISFIGDPSAILNEIQEYIPSGVSGSLSGLSKRVIQTGDGSSLTLNSTNSVLVINPEHRNKVAELMRDRLLLPISLTHFEEIDVLFVSTGRNLSMLDRVLALLKSYGIESKGQAPTLLAEAVQMIPIIDEKNGLMMKEYRLAKDEKTVNDLLSMWPIRMTVFPSEWGLMVLVPDMEVTGLNVETLKQGHESELLLNRNFTAIREVIDSVESAA
ncbi:MAG: hypothetical protein ACFFE2_07075 [Candidatus Thorarchaeota archaeon]